MPVRTVGLRLRETSQRYTDLNGRATAAAITLYGFLALFALAVLAVAIVGFISTDNKDVASDIVHWLGVKGAAATTVTDAVDKARQSRRVASVVGIVGLVWVGSSFAVAVGHAYDIAWRVPQRVGRARLRGLGWLAGAGLLLGAASFVTAGLSALPKVLAPLVLIAGVFVNLLVWLWTSWILPNRRVPWRARLPAALVGAIGLEVLKIVGGYIVPVLVARSSALYGTLGVVFALLTWLLVLGRLVVLVSVREVLDWERNHGTDALTISGPALPQGDERVH